MRMVRVGATRYTNLENAKQQLISSGGKFDNEIHND